MLSVVSCVLLHAHSVIIRLTVFDSHSSVAYLLLFLLYPLLASTLSINLLKPRSDFNAISGDTLSPNNDGGYNLIQQIVVLLKTAK